MAALQSRGETLFSTNAVWRYLKGTEEASFPTRGEWRKPSFDDSGWTPAHAPFFYGDPLSGTELSDMRGFYTSVFLRRSFVVQGAADINQLDLDLYIDDGCLIWINDSLIDRENVPDGDLEFNRTAQGTINVLTFNVDALRLTQNHA